MARSRIQENRSALDPRIDVHDRDLPSAVDRHNAALAALLERLRATSDPDRARAAALGRIRASHPRERVIAFCQYAETVNTLWARLAGEPGVAGFKPDQRLGRILRKELLGLGLLSDERRCQCIGGGPADGGAKVRRGAEQK